MNSERLTVPVITGRKLNVHKTFRRRPGRPLNVLCTFSLRPVYTGVLVGGFVEFQAQVLGLDVNFFVDIKPISFLLHLQVMTTQVEALIEGVQILDLLS